MPARDTTIAATGCSAVMFSSDAHNTIKLRSELDMVCRREKARFASDASLAVVGNYVIHTIELRSEQDKVYRREQAIFARALSTVMDGYLYANTISIRPEWTLPCHRESNVPNVTSRRTGCNDNAHTIDFSTLGVMCQRDGRCLQAVSHWHQNVYNHERC